MAKPGLVRRLIEVSESKYCSVSISAEEARALNDLGGRLASQKSFRGDTTEAPENRSRTVIECVSDGISWKMFASGVVGVIAVGDLQVRIRPKIPKKHFIYLLSHSPFCPRFVREEALTSESEDLLELVASWFVYALEGVVRRGLISDYSEREDELTAIRGELDPLKTAVKFYAGRLRFSCRYEDFGKDTPLNRVLRAAGARVARHPQFQDALRRRAMACVARFDDVSDLQTHDPRVELDRRTVHYADAIWLARLLLAAEARGLDAGEKTAWSFLIPTAALVEDGIRHVLAAALAPGIKVASGSLRLANSSITVNPDLVFEPACGVGDVKYKVYGPEWSRPDLYQAVSFAAAFRAVKAVVISFAATQAVALPTLQFGEIRVSNVVWPTELENPAAASDAFSHAMSEWLFNVSANEAA